MKYNDRVKQKAQELYDIFSVLAGSMIEGKKCVLHAVMLLQVNSVDKETVIKLGLPSWYNTWEFWCDVEKEILNRNKL